MKLKKVKNEDTALQLLQLMDGQAEKCYHTLSERKKRQAEWGEFDPADMTSLDGLNI